MIFRVDFWESSVNTENKEKAYPLPIVLVPHKFSFFFVFLHDTGN